MSDADVTALCARSGYSVVRGTATLESLVQQACRLGHRCLGLADVNSLCGATEFVTEACEGGLTPIVGAELLDGRQAATALVFEEKGYENLCRLVTRRHRAEAPDLAEDLSELFAGLHLLTADVSLAGRLREGGVPRGQLHLAIDPATQPHAQLRRLVQCACRLELSLTATAPAAFALPDDYEVACLLTAVRTGATLDSVGAAELPPRGAWLRSPGDLLRQLKDFPQAVAANRRLAEQCGAYRLLPRRAVFPTYACPDGRSGPQELRRLCRRGLGWRYGGKPPADADCRLETELRLIERMGFSEYFLVVWDIVSYARDRGVPVAGRGSGASSLVAYLLGITNVCPLAFGIPFERFLNPGREDYPDLDIDFCWRIRDDVIDYVFRRWPDGHVAMVCTHNTFQERSALRETAKALGFSDEQISRPDAPGDDQDPRYARLGRLSRRLIGLVRTLSVHPGGVVISPRPIDRTVPVQTAAKGVTITQYDKNGIERIGLVKLDLLGNRSLSTIRESCELIHSRHGRRVDTESISQTDGDTLRLLQQAETVGCNQIESPAMRHLLQALQPAGIVDLMQALALIRPGAAGVGMKDVFIRRRRGLEAVPRAYGPVDSLLDETCGVMLYEDDVMAAAAVMLGASLVEADRFRKAVQKCHDDEQRRDLSRRFLARCRRNGLDSDYAGDIWVQMAKFNSYSFCRAHAGSYAMLAYTLAWLKRHYPLEFWVAALNNNQSMYAPRVYVEQAKRMGIRFLLPDVNDSQQEFSLAGPAIRVGLNRIAGLGPVSVSTILACRVDGPYRGLSDFVQRTDLGREEARSLVLCGALDAFGHPRPQLMMELELQDSRLPKTASRGRRLVTAEPSTPPVASDFSHRRKYIDERRMLGFSVREHIMALHRSALAGATDIDSRRLARHVGRRVRIAGVVEALRTTPTQKGRHMMFLTLEDEFGLFEVTVFPNAFRRRADLTRYGPYIVAGRVEEQYGIVTMTADRVSLFQADRRPRTRRQQAQIRPAR